MDLQRTEHDLLLLCARTRISKEQEEKIKALAEAGVDWNYLAELAKRHGVSSLLYHNIGNRCKNSMPSEAMTSLRTEYQGQAVHNMNLTRRLAKVLNLLIAENIPVIAFKGPLLSMIVYENIALRSFCDLDILIHWEDIDRVKGLLMGQGFRPLHAFTPEEEKAHIRSQMGYEFVSDDQQICVELHWNLIQGWLSYRYDEKLLWERAERVTFAGVSAVTFCPEDLLVYLCMHGFKHKWSQLKWVCDLAEVIRHYVDLEWNVVVERAREQGCTRIVLLGLSLASTLLDVSLPVFVSNAIEKDREVTLFTGLIRSQLLDNPNQESKEIDNLSFRTQLRERTVDRVRYYRHMIYVSMTPDDQDRKSSPLPNSPEALLYVWRVIRLLARFAGRWAQSRKQKKGSV